MKKPDSSDTSLTSVLLGSTMVLRNQRTGPSTVVCRNLGGEQVEEGMEESLGYRGRFSSQKAYIKQQSALFVLYSKIWEKFLKRASRQENPQLKLPGGGGDQVFHLTKGPR